MDTRREGGISVLVGKDATDSSMALFNDIAEKHNARLEDGLWSLIEVYDSNEKRGSRMISR